MVRAFDTSNSINTKESKRVNHNSEPKILNVFFTIFSLLFVFIFAFWWFSPSHIPHNFKGPAEALDILLFISVSYVIFHPIMMEVLTWSISSHIKHIAEYEPQPGLKVAFITTIVPSYEPISLLHQCLPAMVNADYPHDTWLLDEGDNDEVKKICSQYGVYYFTRFGKSHLNTPNGKFNKTKGGNHNSWYEEYGNEYDIVAQIDTDFVPKKHFLMRTLGYFRDPKIAYVVTPQIYGNTKESLVAQGAAEQLYNFYGTVQRGLSGMFSTLLIGANHVIRVAALKDINHYSAHITEDLITGMKLHANGWKSMYLPYALAIGEGPFTWEAYFNQQMRWAYGCMDIFFKYTPRLFYKLGLRRTIYYFFLQQHYFSGIAMALSIFLLSLYFFTGIRAADVDLFQFFTFYSLIIVTCWLMSVWLQQYYVEKKTEGDLLIVGKLINVAVWPIWFLAFVSIITGKRLKYKVTPKGENEIYPKTSLAIFVPHFIFSAIVIAGLISSFFTHRQSSVMIFWAISSLFLLLSVPFIQQLYRAAAIIQSHLFSFFTLYIHPKKQQIITETRVGIQYAIDSSVAFSRRTWLLQKKLDNKRIIVDSIFLAGIVLLSCIPYITKIGFYSDDWAFLGNFTLSRDQSLLGYIKTATSPNTFMRPVQNIYDSLLFSVFGVHPLGYQVVNAFVLVAIVILLYLIIRLLKIPRIIAISISVIYALLPNYSTDRFWYAAFQANISMLFYFFSLYSGLRGFSKATNKKIVWEIVSIISLLVSVLSYEIVLPLVFLNAILFWISTERIGKKEIGKPKILIVTTFIALVYLILFKVKTTTRLAGFNYTAAMITTTISVFRTNYGFYVLDLPYIWGEIFSKYLNPVLILDASILYLGVFWYVYAIASRRYSEFPGRGWMRNMVLISFVVFFLGYAIFFTTNRVGFSPTGIDNRVAIAASIGIALTIVGLIGCITSIIRSKKIAKLFFSIAIAVISAGGFLIINTIALFWEDAYHHQQQILTDIHIHLHTIPKNSTLILDGICPYVGPGVVFESQWDLKGALQTLYREPTLQADIVTPRLKVKQNGIRTQIYTFPILYSYKNLFIYNIKTKKIYPLPNASVASSYFQTYNPDYNNGCPPASAGKGVDIF